MGGQNQGGFCGVALPVGWVGAGAGGNGGAIVIAACVACGIVAQRSGAQGFCMHGAGQRVARCPALALCQQQFGVHVVLGEGAGLV